MDQLLLATLTTLESRALLVQREVADVAFELLVAEIDQVALDVDDAVRIPLTFEPFWASGSRST